MKNIRSAFLFLFAFGFTLVVLEVFLGFTETVNKSFNSFDSGYGRTRKASSKFLDFTEGFGFGRFNEYGYLGPAYPIEKDPGAIRIALVGDSYVEGFQVFERHHFRSLVEQDLTRRLNRPVEILNFGRSGFDLDDMYAYDRLLVQKFAPDITLYFISNKDLLSEEDADALLPDVELVSTGRLKIHTPDEKDKIEEYQDQLFWMQNSTMAMLVRNCLKLVEKKDMLYKKIFDKLYWGPEEQEGSETPQKPVIPEENLQIIREITSKGTYIVNRDKTPLLLQPEHQKNLILNVPEVLSNGQVYDESYHHWEVSGVKGHWNQKAHALIAKSLSDKLFERIGSEKI